MSICFGFIVSDFFDDFSFEVVESGQKDSSGDYIYSYKILSSQPEANRYDLSVIAANSTEFNDGLVTWCFRSFLSRSPSSSEMFHYSKHYEVNYDLPYVIREAMKTDEYANF